METLDLKTIPQSATHLLEEVQGQLSTKSETPLPTETPEKLPRPLLDKLWMKMTEMYGHRWTANFGVLADPNHSWASVLKGINGQQIANGLNALVEKADEFDWPPPANVFRAMCLNVPGMPTIQEAWVEALMGTYSHEAIRIAAEATSTFDLRTAKQGDKALFQRFERNYAIVIRRAQTGQPLNGRIAHGIASDSMRDRRQVQLEASRKEVDALVIQQGIPTNGKSARELLLAKFGIRSDRHA